MAGIEITSRTVRMAEEQGLAAEVYRLAKLMPKAEEYQLTSPLLCAAALVPADIAKAHARRTHNDYVHFVSIARGSLAETATFLFLTNKVGLLKPEHVEPALAHRTKIGKMLTVLLIRLHELPRHLCPEAYSLQPIPHNLP